MTSRLFSLSATVAVSVVLTVFSYGCSGDPPVTPPDDDDTGPIYVDSIDMVYVDGGTFMMGCDAARFGNECNPDAPLHEVSLGGFYIGKYEVTQKLWQDVMGGNPAYNSWYDDLTLPVEQVSWNDVQKFITKLNKATGESYRLPTEAEWEYAARGGAGGGNFEFSGSDDVDNVAWYKNNSDAQSHPVGGKQPNALGVYDMSGNVAEWVADWYDDKYYAVSPRDNPKGPSSATSSRCFRGGTWLYNPVASRVFRRDMAAPETKNNYLGFRLARQ